MLKKSIENGSAYAKFAEFVKSQGGDVSVLDDCDSIINARYIVDIVSENSGYVSSIQSELIGETAMILGGGRQNKGDDIDHSVGVVLSKKVGVTIQIQMVSFFVHSLLPRDTKHITYKLTCPVCNFREVIN